MFDRCFGKAREVGGTRVVESYPFTRLADAPSPYPPNRISNTKYSLLTFVPLNLWQQCSQHMNRYFILIALLQLWADITPVAPITTWGPLAVIFAISALKEGVDDMRRYRSDQQANERKVQVLRDERWQEILSEQLVVGDIMRVMENEEIPADMVLLQSAERDAGSAYIQTSNLDGETNLKQRYTAHLDEMQPLSESELARLHITVECAHPNNEVYKFDSTLELPPDWVWHAGAAAPRDSSSLPSPSASSSSGRLPSRTPSPSPSPSAAPRTRRVPLSSDNLLLQATFLRNTPWVVGLVVYTGNETKVGMNKAQPRPKYTKLDEGINRITLVVFALQLLLIIIWGIVGAVLEKSYEHATEIDHDTDSVPKSYLSPRSGNAWYLMYSVSTVSPSWLSVIIIPLRFLLLASMMIPISLKVSLDLIKLYYALLIDWDAAMAVRGADGVSVYAKASNTSISENLGQVRYVLSDKTGTFTENVMIFRKMCDAKGNKYGEQQQQQQQAAGEKKKSKAVEARSSDASLASGGAPGHEKRRDSISSRSDSHAAVGVDILADPHLIRAIQTREDALTFLLKAMSLCNTVVPSMVEVTTSGAANEESASARSKKLSSSARAGLPAAGAQGATAPHQIPSGRPLQGMGPTALVASGRSLEMVSSMEREPSALVRAGGGAQGGGEEEEADSRLPRSLLSDSDAAGILPSDSVSNFGLASETVQQSQSFTVAMANGGGAAPSTPPAGMQIHYASSSPDELSLVEFASQAGFKLLEKNGAVMRISMPAGGAAAGSSSPEPTIEDWEVLQVLEFSSDRKRMSVLLRQVGAGAAQDGRVLLLCKGADDVIFARLRQNEENAASMVHVRTSLEEYASAGLRTLCFAYRYLNPSDYSAFASLSAAASLDILNREASLVAAYETVEKEMLLVGCTGIEDKLQEGLRESIEMLREANIKVWMLTGDKFQTALEISKACKLYKPKEGPGAAAQHGGQFGNGSVSLDMGSAPSVAATPSAGGEGDTLYTLEGESPDAVRTCLLDVSRCALDGNNLALHPYCLIVDGRTLTFLLSDELESMFATLSLQAVSCICCRTTPSQKAAMVTLVRHHSQFISHDDNNSPLDEQMSGQVASLSPRSFSPPLAGVGPGDLVEHLRATDGEDSDGRAIGGVSGAKKHHHASSPVGLKKHVGGVTGSVSAWFSKLVSPGGDVVLAIGDGGNDCSMIQQADVGVGIIGKEGLQAARAADYSFTQFRSLTRLLFVHGRYSYNRTAFVAQYCFYKLFYAFLSEFSGASYFDSYSLMTYNLFYTSLPTILFVLEQDLSPVMLQHNPQLYTTTQRGDGFTGRTLGGWLGRAVAQAILLIGFAAATHHGSHASTAFGMEGQLSNSLVIYTACVLIHPLTIAIESTYITWIHHVVLWGTVLLFVIINLLLSVLSPHMDLWRVYTILLGDGEYYLRVIVITSACMVWVLMGKYVRQRYWPSIVQRAREADIQYHARYPEMRRYGSKAASLYSADAATVTDKVTY